MNSGEMLAAKNRVFSKNPVLVIWGIVFEFQAAKDLHK